MNDTSAGIAAAKIIAGCAHDGQTDLSGDDYMGHIDRVASNFNDDDPAKIAAILHDTVEDSPLTVGAICSGFGYEISDAVAALTHRPSDSYDEYIDNIACNDIAARVKLADLEDNLDLSRLDSITPDDLDRCVTYGHAHRKLTEANS